MNEDQSWPNELQKQVDDAHHTTDRADAPPAGLWSSIRAQVQPQPQTIVETKESQPMITTATLPQSIAAPMRSTPQDQAGGFRHYVNFAATVALVLAVAGGGWLAMMQVNQPDGGPEPRFAALGLQPEEEGNGVCDAEPLTVDETIFIVKDPIGSLIPEIEDPAALGYPEDWFGPRAITVPNVYWYMAQVYELDYFGMDLPQADFEAAQPVVNEFLDCLQSGTRGQLWRLMDPITVHALATQYLPTLSSEDTARVVLPDILEAPAHPNSGGSVDTRIIRINPDSSLTGYLAASNRTGFPGFAISPVIHVEENGDVLTEADRHGISVDDPDHDAEGAMNIIYGRSAVDNQWYVIDYFFPFAFPGTD